MKLSYLIPKSWRWIRLGSVSQEIQYGLNEPADEAGNGPVFLRISDIDDNGSLQSGKRKRLIQKPINGDNYRLNPGDILIARSGNTIGKSFLVTDQQSDWVFASYLIRFRLNPDLVNPEYVAFCLRSTVFMQYVNKVGRTVAQPNINSRELAAFQFPLPPIPEQQRIVEILKQADSLRTQRQDVLEKIKQIPTTLFLEMFGDPVSNPHKYSVKPLARLGTLDRGISKHRPRDAVHLYGGNYPFIQTGDVANSGGWIASFSQSYSDAGLHQSRLWPSGTLCITIAANIAQTGILEFDACFPDSVVGFLAGEEVTSEYIMVAINLWQKILEAQAPQAAQKNINLKTLRALKLPVPPIEEQLKFSALLKECRKLLITHEKLSSESFKMDNHLRATAFSGELTQSWREAHQAEIQAWLREQKKIKPQEASRVISQDTAPPERAAPGRLTRRWLMDQLSALQRHVYDSMHEWKGTLIPSEDLDDFMAQWPIEHLQDKHNHVLCAMEQLAGLGLIARISVPNQEGEYVTAYRTLREEERSQINDLKRLEA